MLSEETVHVSPVEVIPTLGKGTLGTWRFCRSVGVVGLRAANEPRVWDGTKHWVNHRRWGVLRVGA
jgi:hypothetical protein